jgi:hypothetical protein
VAVPRKPDGSVDGLLEIAPSFALDPADAAAKRDKVPPLKPGDRLYLE